MDVQWMDWIVSFLKVLYLKYLKNYDYAQKDMHIAEKGFAEA